MTSEDTHARTLTLLEAHAYFGADPGQVTLMKQEKVCMGVDGVCVCVCVWGG
jgi:UDP-sugar pyrophosphorylase